MTLLALLLTAPVQQAFPPESRIFGFWEEAEAFGAVTPETSHYLLIPDALAADDLDADFVPDFVFIGTGGGVGWDPLDLVAVCGRTHVELWRTAIGDAGSWTGHALCHIDDIDGDGVREILVGAPTAPQPDRLPPWSSPSGAVQVVSGATGAILRAHATGEAYAQFGWAIASLDDVDGDGTGDYLVGAPQDWTWSSRFGSIRAYSGRTGTELYARRGTVWGDRFGESILPVRDHDGDGLEDYLVGGSGYQWKGRISLHSAADGSVLRTWTGRYGDLIGSTLCMLDDLDGDGLEDFATPRRRYSSEHSILVLAAGSTAQIREISPETNANQGFGADVESIADVTGDGLRDLLVGAPSAFTPYQFAPGCIRVIDSVSGKTLSSIVSPLPPTLVTPRTGKRVGRSLVDPATGRPGFLAPFPSGTGYSYALLTLNPGIRLDSGTVSVASAPHRVRLNVTMPPGEAGCSYLVLVSSRPAPQTTMLGIDVPVGTSPLMSRYLLGSGSTLHSGMQGKLDAAGRARAWFQVPRRAAAYTGRTLHFCALSFDLLSGRRSTAAATLELVP